MPNYGELQDVYAAGRFPAEPFIRVIQRFIDGLEMGDVYRSPFGSSTRQHIDHQYSAIEAVAKWAGVNWDHLSRVLAGRFKTVTFDYADKVIVATVGPGVWYADPDLNEHYERLFPVAA